MIPASALASLARSGPLIPSPAAAAAAASSVCGLLLHHGGGAHPAAGSPLGAGAHERAAWRSMSTGGGGATAVAAAREQPSTSGLPEAPLYKLRLKVHGYQLRFLQEASVVIRDLLLLHSTPTAASAALARDGRGRGARTWPAQQLRLPLGHASLPKRRTLYTVLRSPHVDKTSREQFEKVVHTRVIDHETRSLPELRWLLDSLRMYQFTGVQIDIKLTSPTYLTPTPPEDEAEAARPLLSAHRRAWSRFFDAAGAPPSPPLLQPPGEAAPGAPAAAAAAVAALMAAVQQPGRAPASSGAEGSAGGVRAAPPASPAALDPLTAAVHERMAGSPLGAGGAPQNPVLAALEASLSGLDLSSVDERHLAPLLMAHYPLGDPSAPPAAEWLYAALKAWQRQLRDSGADEASREEYRRRGEVTRAVMFSMLRLWHSATTLERDAGGAASAAAPRAAARPRARDASSAATGRAG